MSAIDMHLCFTSGALKWIYLASAFSAGGPSTLTELSTIVALWFALCFLCRISREFSPFASSSWWVSSVVSFDALVRLRYLTRALCQKNAVVKSFCGVDGKLATCVDLPATECEIAMRPFVYTCYEKTEQVSSSSPVPTICTNDLFQWSYSTLQTIFDAALC